MWGWLADWNTRKFVGLKYVHVAAQQKAEGPELAVFADGKEHVLRGTWHGENW